MIVVAGVGVLFGLVMNVMINHLCETILMCVNQSDRGTLISTFNNDDGYDSKGSNITLVLISSSVHCA